ncbi:hypothetical protein BDV26DRAFT_255619 [Aspergillus bertholletiae]|uniref:Uncharacterized protein n=1 Tax=Aspergillus bertholletiae TaxID=1226010 RepID=A0A5N7BI85_9EURO|nr:hypothetical protein BDV26DRAFT_255619 [Aspergillus bertholletiae]
MIWSWGVHLTGRAETPLFRLSVLRVSASSLESPSLIPTHASLGIIFSFLVESHRLRRSVLHLVSLLWTTCRLTRKLCSSLPSSSPLYRAHTHLHSASSINHIIKLLPDLRSLRVPDFRLSTSSPA